MVYIYNFSCKIKWKYFCYLKVTCVNWNASLLSDNCSVFMTFYSHFTFSNGFNSQTNLQNSWHQVSFLVPFKTLMANIGITYSYLIYSTIAAKITRRALKPEFLKKAFRREISLINIFHMKNGVRGEKFVPLQPKVEEEVTVKKTADSPKVKQTQ